MFQYQIDLGQIILIFIGLLISVVAWFTKRDIIQFGRRLDKHDDVLFQLAGSVQRLIGYYEATLNRNDRRSD